MSRSTRTALTSLFVFAAFIAPILGSGTRPAFAGSVAIVDPRPLAAPREANPSAEAAESPSVAADPTASPVTDSTPAAANATPATAEVTPVDASVPAPAEAESPVPPSAAPPAADAAKPASANGATDAAAPVSVSAAPTTYVVQAKDTLFSIARRHGVSVDALLWANKLTDANVLKAGQKLTIPPSSGKLYTAKDGDTLDAVAKMNGVSKLGIATVNGLAEDAGLTAGQRLLIPSPRQEGLADPAFTPSSAPVTAAQVGPPAAIPTASATPSPVTTLAPPATTPTPAATPTSLVSAAAPLVKPTSAPSATPSGAPSVTITTRKLPKLEWPIALKAPTIVITTPFRPVATGPSFDERKHDGIDIGAPRGFTVKAAADGTVKRAEVGMNGGYGTVVVVDHGDGITSWYAHLSAMSVAVGDQVQVGQKLGEVGDTGDSRGNHLHFEVRINSTPIDPRIGLQ